MRQMLRFPVPNFGTGYVDVPQVEVPQVDIPDVSVAEVDLPEAGIPAAIVADVDVPDVSIPDVDVPDVGIPEVEATDLADTIEQVEVTGISTSTVAKTVIAGAAVAGIASVASEPATAVIATTSATAAVSREDLKNIRGIDAGIEDQLNRGGITSYSQIAAWSSSDVAMVQESLGIDGRVQQENWIEQAQVLAGGGQTIYSRSRGYEGRTCCCGNTRSA